MKKLLLIISTTALLASCSTVATSSKAGKSQPNVTDTNWVLADQVKGDVPTLRLESARIGGNAGCNTFFSDASIDPSTGSFKAAAIASTKKMCPNMSVEQNYLKMLSEANRYVVNGSVLELYKDNLLLLKFNKN